MNTNLVDIILQQAPDVSEQILQSYLLGARITALVGMSLLIVCIHLTVYSYRRVKETDRLLAPYTLFIGCIFGFVFILIMGDGLLRCYKVTHMPKAVIIEKLLKR